MKIFFPVIKNNNLSLSALKRFFKAQTVCDKFEMANPIESKFKYIKLKNVEKLYNTNFTLSDKDYGAYTFKTFVFDKKGEKPVEMVVKPVLFDRYQEEYIILAPNHFDNNGEMLVAGKRYFSLDGPINQVSSGSMESYLKGDYSWIGIRLHQIALERMFMLKRSNIKINSVPEAYIFHKNCGFEPVSETLIINENEFNNKLDEYSSVFEIDRDIVKNLVVCKRIFNYLLDENLSCANLLEYALKNNIDVYNCPTVRMEMSDGAKREWKEIIYKQRIFKGARLPHKYQ